MLDELQKVSPQCFLVRDDITRGDQRLQLRLVGQIPAQNKDCGVGLFNEFDEARLGQGPVPRPVVPLTSLVAVGNIIKLLKAPRLQRATCSQYTYHQLAVKLYCVHPDHSCTNGRQVGAMA